MPQHKLKISTSWQTTNKSGELSTSAAFKHKACRDMGDAGHEDYLGSQ